MDERKRILFLCNSDYGQANVVLATSYALLETGAPVELHIGSEPPMKPELEATVRLANDTLRASAPHTVHFHSIEGVSHFRAMSRPRTGIIELWNLPLPSFANTAAFLRRFGKAMVPWDLDELVAMYTQTLAIIEEVRPHLTVVDALCVAGLTAARQLKIEWTVLAPNTIKDFSALRQPRGAWFWKYPVIGSALPYPIPWSQIPVNIGLTLFLLLVLVTDTHLKAAARRLKEHAGDDTLRLVTLGDLTRRPPLGLRVMVAFSQDLDYPVSVVPDHIVECGPIVRYAPRLVDVDPNLEAWLGRGPSMYVNLGSQLTMTPAQGLAFALALRDFLDAAGPGSGYQILWKVKQEGGQGPALSWAGEWAAVYATLRSEMEADRVRVTAWVEADPCSILQSGHVVCSVHHGGANSHHEALAAGVPQVVVPGWIDCYDFANRVELNGVGARANKTGAPRWTRGELRDALVGVMLGHRATALTKKARQLAERHPGHAGRNKAAHMLLRAVQLEGVAPHACVAGTP